MQPTESKTLLLNQKFLPFVVTGSSKHVVSSYYVNTQVSNGAECIMLSKKFFITHANEQVKKLIRYQVQPYPTHAMLQENLQTQVGKNKNSS